MNSLNRTAVGTNSALNSPVHPNGIGHEGESDAMKLPRIFLKYSSFQELVSGFIAATGTLAIAVSLAACQPKNGAGPSVDGTSQTPSATAVPPAQGTGDSGGGNGLKGAFLEAYSFQPWDRPEFQKVMGPVIEHLIKIDPNYRVLAFLAMATASDEKRVDIQIVSGELLEQHINKVSPSRNSTGMWLRAR